MATKSVEWSSTICVSCAGCSPSDIIVCVNPILIAQKACTGLESTTDFVYNTILGQLLSCVTLGECTGTKAFKYTIIYDDTQLIPDTTLSSGDITGIVCAGCLTKYVEDLAGNEINVEVVDSQVTITTQHGCQYVFDVGGGSGGCSLTVADTSTVDLTLTDCPDQVLSADVLLSADEGNIMEVRSDGLFATTTLSNLSITDTKACTEVFEFKDGDTVLADIELTDRNFYTQTAHGFTMPAWGLLPLTWDSGLSKFILAQADSYAHVAVLLAIDLPDADTIKFFDGSFASITHNLTVGAWYALDPVTAGNIVPASSLDPDYDIYQTLFFTLTSDCVLVRLDSCQCPAVTPPPPPPPPDAIIIETFSHDGDCGLDPFWEPPGFDDSLYSPNTAQPKFVNSPVPDGFSCAANYFTKTGTDETTPLLLGKTMNFSEIYLEWQTYPKSNGSLPYPWGGTKLARMGDPAGTGTLIPFVYIESPSGTEHGNFQCFVINDTGDQLATNNQENIFVDDVYQKLGVYVKLNTPGVADGILQKFYNDTLVFSAMDVLYRHIGNTSQFGFFWIMANNSWGNGAGAPTYPSPPHFSVPSPGGNLYLAAIRVLATKPGSLP